MVNVDDVKLGNKLVSIYIMPKRRKRISLVGVKGISSNIQSYNTLKKIQTANKNLILIDNLSKAKKTIQLPGSLGNINSIFK